MGQVYEGPSTRDGGNSFQIAFQTQRNLQLAEMPAVSVVQHAPCSETCLFHRQLPAWAFNYLRTIIHRPQDLSIRRDRLMHRRAFAVAASWEREGRRVRRAAP